MKLPRRSMPFSRTEDTKRRSGKRPALSSLAAYAFLLPAFFFFFVFTFWPVAYSVFLSFFDWKLGYSSMSFIGSKNYLHLFAMADFWNSLRNTGVFSFFLVFFSLFFGLAASLAVSRIKRFNTLFQMIMFLPVAATMAAMAVVWRYVFDTNFGVLNDLLGRIGIPPQAWLTSDATAMAAVVIVGIWSNIGYAMVFFWAGLSNIPLELYEAAELDGAGALKRFSRITWPLLSPTTLFVTVIITVRAINSFDLVKVLTNGGPVKSTQVLSHLLYQHGFQFFDTGFASGIAIVFFIIILGITWIQMRFEKLVHYY